RRELRQILEQAQAHRTITRFVFHVCPAKLECMKRLEPVIWAKGTFLTPQHLQIQDRFLENTLRFQLDALSFRPWGCRQFQANQESVTAGTFAISSASGIFPDGLLFDIPNSDSAPPPRPLAELFAPEQEEMVVYLAIPQYRERGLNVST